MRTEDLRTYSMVGKALWADGNRAGRITLETLGAVALLELPPDSAIERASSALLSRAGRDASGAGEAISNPFFRLSPEERLVLSALHGGKWPYDRLARILGVTRERVAEIAWGARLDLAFRPGAPAFLAHPVGPSGPNAASCPEFDPRRPWTQAFLDEQLGAEPRIFLQEHAMRCEPCRQALSRTRALYYSVEKVIPLLASSEADARVDLLSKALLRSRVITEPASLTFAESLEIFFSRPEVRKLLLGAAAALVLIRFL